MSGEWIEWNGGECSLPMGTLVQIRCRDGVLRDGIVPVQDIDHWTHMPNNAGADIVQYRVMATDDSWIEWKGAKCPVPDDMVVEVQCRDGVPRDGNPATAFHWNHETGNEGADIVRYRIANDGWIEWSGGTCPVPDDVVVEVALGFDDRSAGTALAGTMRWSRLGDGNLADIVRYRVFAADAGMLPIEPVTEHPLTAIFNAALAQVTDGKGAERHGNGAEFMDQPWLHLANVHGNGFLTGQAAKKLDEAQGMTEHERWEREMLGAIVYAAMAIIHRRGVL